jgi:hypothetical protein
LQSTDARARPVGCQVNRKGLRNTVALNDQESKITSGWLSGQLFDVTHPTPRASTTSDSLRLPEATRLQFARANDLAAVVRQMTAPSLQSPEPFDRRASHMVCG